MPRGQHMTERYGGLDGSFSAQLQQFAEAAKGAMDLTFREVVIAVGRNLIVMSPVGNPDIWKINIESQERAGEQVAAYNAKASSINAAITAEPSNYTKNGSLKRGIKYRKPLMTGAVVPVSCGPFVRRSEPLDHAVPVGSMDGRSHAKVAVFPRP